MYSARMLKSRDSAELTASVPYAEGRHIAAVSAGECPLDLHPASRFPWFALASGSYFRRTASNSIVAPWLDGRNDLLAHAFTMQMEQVPSWPWPLLRAEFLVAPKSLGSGKEDELRAPIDETTATERDQQRAKIMSLEPWALGARYWVESVTNVFDTQIPTAYTLDVLWQGVGVSEPNTNVAQRFIGSVTNIERISQSVSGRPDPIGIITVTDFRFKRQGAEELRYAVADNKWREADDPLLLKEAAIKKGTPPKTKSSKSRNRTVVRFVVVFCAVLPVVLYLALRWRRLLRRTS